MIVKGDAPQRVREAAAAGNPIPGGLATMYSSPRASWTDRGGRWIEPHYHDIPFAYVFDATGLVDGSRQENLSMEMDGDHFILRRVAGMQNCLGNSATPGFFQLRDASRTNVFSSPILGGSTTGALNGQMMILPEKHYPGDGSMQFGLFPVARVGTTGQDAYLLFQGVKRKYGRLEYPGRADYNYYLRPRVYVLTSPSVTWTRSDVPRVFSIEIQDYDFEWYRFMQVNNATGIISTGVLDYQFLDWQGIGLSGSGQGNNGYIPDSYCIDPIYRLAASNVQAVGTFPTTAVVYPKGAHLRVVARGHSIAAPVAQTLQLAFFGAQRIPC